LAHKDRKHVTSVRVRGEQVRRFILEHLEHHPKDIARVTAAKFRISRQAINKHLQNLVDERAVVSKGLTSSRVYRLAPLLEWTKTYNLRDPLTEDAAWRDLTPSLGQLPENLSRIWHYGFTEMFNNVIDHSVADLVRVRLKKTAASTEVAIDDDGVGIFRKIKNALGLLDERHSVLELAKGKFTTDPARHTGEGIFFTSRSFDDFQIFSGDVYFSHDFGDAEDWILERNTSSSGTLVLMRLHNHTARTLKYIFDQYSEGDFGFTKTVVPVKLAQYGDDNLVSRSQAKRLLARVDRFRTVVLNFQGVETIGQSFADEIFRVFRQLNPDVKLVEIHANSEVAAVIARASAAAVLATTAGPLVK
jgi:hypothetical protein